MKLTQITTKNLKGRSVTVPVSPVTVIHGGNATGKTSILTAIRMGLLGYDPKLGKRPSDTFQNASGREMAVQLDFNDNDGNVMGGRVCKWTKGKSISYDGPEPLVSSMLLDIQDFFNLTAQQRRDHVMSMLSVKFDDNQLYNKLVFENDASPEVVSIREEFEFWMADRDEHGTPVSDWMAGNVERTKERIKSHEATIKSKNALIQAIAQEKAQNPVAVPKDRSGEVKNLEAELQKATELMKSLAPEKEPEFDAKEHNKLEYDSTTRLPQLIGETARKIAETQKQISDAEAVNCCPTCKSEDGWKALKEAHLKALKDSLCKLVDIKTAHEEALTQARKAYGDSFQAKHVMELSQKGFRDAQQVAYRLQTQFQSLQSEIKSSQQLRDRLLAREAQSATAEKERDEAMDALEVAKSVLKILVEIQDEIVNSAFDPFLKLVRRFTDDVLGMKLEFKDGEIGYTRNGVFVTHETFSGSEQAVTYAGLACALVQNSPIKLVMIDETILDTGTKQRMAQRFQELVADGTVDNVIIVDVSPEQWPETVAKVDVATL